MPAIRRGNLPRRKGPWFLFTATTLGVIMVIVFSWIAIVQDGNATLGLGAFLQHAKEIQNHDKMSLPKFRVSNKIVKQKERPLVTAADFQGRKLLLSNDDPIYKWGSWDEAPIVVESHKLLFFTIPKCGCTVWKQLFRRMYGWQNWKVHDEYLPHHPISNGLNYLYHYKPDEAEKMLTDPSWTRAILFRDPKERLLSAYLDKVLHNHGKYVRVHCCRGNNSLNLSLQCQVPEEKIHDPLLTFHDFLEKVVPHCNDPHWRAQAHRIPDKYWPHINFVGHMDRIEQDAKDLLQKINAWEDFGAVGWESGSIFAGAASVAHATDARRKVSVYYSTKDLIRQAELLHKEDYEHHVVAVSKRRQSNFVLWK